MKITNIHINDIIREITIFFEHKQHIIYSKFGNDLFAGNRLTELVYKENELLFELKSVALDTYYFQNNVTAKPSENEILYLEEVLDVFIGKEI